MKTNGAGKRVTVITASLVLAFLALGCGEQKEGAAVKTDATPIAAMERTSSAVVVATGATPEAGPGAGLKATDDSLPPDVSVFAPDSLVTPGNVVEITAQASTDAATVTLTDRLGHKYPFVYDTEAKAWRVHYRVPIQTRIDKLGLSVTATSGANRWKRVWVFLGIMGGVPADDGGC